MTLGERRGKNNMDRSENTAAEPERKGNGIDGSIRVRSALRISVNDEGGEILIPVEDAQFIEDFFTALDGFTKIRDNIRSRTAGLEGAELVKPVIEELRNVTAELDRLFGEGCCRKVFGDTVPSPYAIADFFEQMMPIIESYTAARQQRMAEKYGQYNRQQRRRYRKGQK